MWRRGVGGVEKGGVLNRGGMGAVGGGQGGGGGTRKGIPCENGRLSLGIEWEALLTKTKRFEGDVWEEWGCDIWEEWVSERKCACLSASCDSIRMSCSELLIRGVRSTHTPEGFAFHQRLCATKRDGAGDAAAGSLCSS